MKLNKRVRQMLADTTPEAREWQAAAEEAATMRRVAEQYAATVGHTRDGKVIRPVTAWNTAADREINVALRRFYRT